MTSTQAPVDRIVLAAKEGRTPDPQPVYGGYANARGIISLFTDTYALRVNFKTRTLQERPLLNAGAQARYDAAAPGETFEYCGTSFRRLSSSEIAEICGSGTFRLGYRSI